MVQKWVNVNLFFGDVDFRTIFGSSGFDDQAWVSVKLPLRNWSAFDIEFIAEDTYKTINGVNMKSYILWLFSLFAPDFRTLIFKCIKDTRQLLLNWKFLELFSHIFMLLLIFLKLVLVIVHFFLSFFDSFLSLL